MVNNCNLLKANLFFSFSEKDDTLYMKIVHCFGILQSKNKNVEKNPPPILASGSKGLNKDLFLFSTCHPIVENAF